MKSKYLHYQYIAVIVLLNITLGACDKKKPKVQIPDSFNPATYTASYTTYNTYGQPVTSVFPPFVNLGISTKLIGTTTKLDQYGNPSPWPIALSSPNVIFSGNLSVKNQFFLLRRKVLQTFTVPCVDDYNQINYSYLFTQGEEVSFIFNTSFYNAWFVNYLWSPYFAPLNDGDSIEILKFAVNDGDEDLSMTTSTSRVVVKYDSATQTIQRVDSFPTPTIPKHSIKALHSQTIYRGPIGYELQFTIDQNSQIPDSWKGNVTSTDNVTDFVH